jgi:RHS repeat-associated protein
MKLFAKCLALLTGLLFAGTTLAQTTPFVPLVPARLMDTRTGGQTVDGQFVGGHMTAGQTKNLTILGRDGMPNMSGVSAVALNVTVTNASGAGFLVAWPSGAAQPNTSNLNFDQTQAISNQVIVPIGTGGQVAIYVNSAADVIADVAGYFPSASAFTPLTPARLLDTRLGGGPVGPGGQLNLTVLGAGGVPSSGVSAVVVNVTATNATAPTFITVWPTSATRPTNASNLNVVAGQTIPNLVMVGVGTSGNISFYNNAGSTDLIADVVGYFPLTAPAFDSLVPARLMDTRTGGQTVDGQFVGGHMTSGTPLNLTVLGRGNVPTSGVGAVALNVTAVTPSSTGFITAWGTSTTTGNAPPLAMQLNFTAGSIIPSLVIAQVGANGQVSLANNTGTTDVLADVVGWFPGPPLAPASVTATSTGGGAVTVNWTLNSGGTTPTYLEIQRATNLAGQWTLINGDYTPATSGQITDLVFADATYYYRVSACNLVGCSAFTTSSGTAVSTIPGAPTSSTPTVVSVPATDPVSDAVGATLAQFRVDEAGNATYSVPIQVPPGTAGMAPKLALSYNSRLPDGIMGPGWTIEGASQITRCRQTRESGDFANTSIPDGNAPPVNYTSTDRFCLDGVRLLLTSGTYGADTSTYSPETDPTTRVTATVLAGTVGPSAFKVQRKDGTTSTYGYLNTSPDPKALITASLNSQTVAVSWNLARVQDSTGNYMDYLYYSQPGIGTYAFAAGAVESTLKQVNYTGHATSPVSSTYATVAFGYITLSSVNQVRLGYAGSVAFAQTQQLVSVTVSDNTVGTLRYYSLSYLTSASGSNFPQLQQVKECRDSGMTLCFPPTTFTWSAATYAFASDTTQTQNTPTFVNLIGYKVADVDGDGRLDFVWAANNGGACGTHSSIYVGFMDRNATTQQMTLTMAAPGASQTPICAPIDLNGNDQAWYLVDYDGDGRADLMIGGASSSTWAIYSSTGRPTTSGGTVFNTSTNLLSPLTTPIKAPNCYIDFTGAQICNNAAGILGDFNGDGLPDFIYPDPNSTDTSALLLRIMVRKTDGSGTFQFSEPYVVSLGDVSAVCPDTVDTCTFNFFNRNNGAPRSAIAVDVNGDGRADLTLLINGVTNNNGNVIIGPSPSTPKRTRLTYDPQVGKTNSGVGPDAAGMTRHTYWYQFASQGPVPGTGGPASGGTIQFPLFWDGPTTNAGGVLPILQANFYVADLNGDGLTDIVYQDPASVIRFWVMVNTGQSYQAAIFVDTTLCTISACESNTTPPVPPPLVLADINGDGKTDLAFPDSTTSYNYVSLVPSTTAPGGWAFTSPVVPSLTAIHSSTNWIAMIADFDGDGAPDFFSVQTAATGNNLYTSRSAGGTSCPATTNSIACSRYHPRDAVIGFTNGLGANTTVAYQPLTNVGVYQRASSSTYPALTTAKDFGWGSPVFDVMAPMYVVSQASSSAPTYASAGAQSTVYYRYAGALMQAGGRGFLGFYENWSFDTNDSSTTGKYVATLNHYAQRYPVIGMPTGTLKQVFTGTTVDRQSPTLNACAANTEDPTYNCFSGVTVTGGILTFQTPWPSLASGYGTRLSLGLQVPICAGAGCQVSATASECVVGGGTTAPSTGNPFIGPANPGPVFGYVAWTWDIQYDINTGSPTTPVTNASTQNFFCYDGNGSSAGYGNLFNSRTLTQDGSAVTVAEKATANTFTDDPTRWYRGRMTQSTVTFARPSLSNVPRTTNFGYDTNTGLLTAERIQQTVNANEALSTLYTLDAYGNRVAAYQCSNDLSDTQCKTTASGFVERQTGTQVHRYAKTTYDSIGRYSTGSALPFTNTSGGWNEQTALIVQARDEFGNPVQQKSINDTSGYVLPSNQLLTTQFAKFGAFGRQYFSADNTGKASTTTYRMCGTGSGQVGCSTDTRLVFRSQTLTVGAPASWTYYDVLGRPVLQVTRSFDTNGSTNQFSAVCTYTDAHNRPVYQSEPFFAPATVAGDGSPSFTSSPCASAAYATTTTHDVIGRVTILTQPDTNVINKTYVGLVTTTSSPRNASFIWSQTINALGEVISTQDPTVTGDTTVGLTVTTTYYAAGDVHTIQRDAGSGTITSSFAYDELGRKTSQSDPDSGNTSFTYNAAGDVISQFDQKGQTITVSYDALGRKWQRATSNAADGNNLTDTWTYDTSANGYGQLASESRSATSSAAIAFSRSVVYDAYGRLRTRTTTIGITAYTESTAYDANGRVLAQQDASGYKVTPAYSANGYTQTLTDSRIGTLYQLLTTTARGQVASDQRGGSTTLQSELTYYANTGRLSTVCSGASGTCNLQDLAYSFDAAGDLSMRTRAFHGASTAEAFTYDALNRVTLAQLVKISGSVVTPYPTLTLTYDKLGNICTKTPINSSAITYTYAGLAGCTHNSLGSPHAVIFANSTSYGYDADGNQINNGNFPGARAISYNALNQVTQSTDGITVTFQYGPDGDRFVRSDSDTGITTYYVGKTEIRAAGNSSEVRRYLGGVAIDYVRSSGSNETRYTFADHLGSMDVIASTTGTVLESQSFDAHGSRRDPTVWYGSAPVPTDTNVGFTSQEHVDSQSFIHMNGRIYDPQLGRMLQVDPVQNPGSQGLNKYSYVVNNPLTLTDPSGYSWWREIVSIAIDVVSAYFAVQTGGLYGLAIAAAGGFAGGVVATGTLQGGLYGAFSGALFYGIAEGVSSAGWAQANQGEGVLGTNLTSIGYTSSVIAHGIAGGVVSDLEGGKFGSGFASAGVAEAFSGVIDHLDPANPIGQTISAERVVASAIVGGTTSQVTGGKFANGARSAAFSQAFSEGIVAASNPNRQPLPGNWLARQGVGLLDLAGKIWALPDTVLGLGIGIAGVPFGATMTLGHNAIQFENYPWGNGALTLGNTIIYGGGEYPGDTRTGVYNDPRFLNVGRHEEGHTFQAQVFGVFFLPAYFISGGIDFDNPNVFEQGANNYAGGGGWWPWSKK